MIESAPPNVAEATALAHPAAQRRLNDWVSRGRAIGEPWHMYPATPPRWAGVLPGPKVSRRALARMAAHARMTFAPRRAIARQGRADYAAGIHNARIMAHTMAWLPPSERRELSAALRARNDLDRQYQAQFPNIPEREAARYRPEGQLALDREVAKARRQRRAAAEARATAWLRGDPGT